MKHRIVFSSVVLGAAALLSAEELPFERTGNARGRRSIRRSIRGSSLTSSTAIIQDNGMTGVCSMTMPCGRRRIRSSNPSGARWKA